MGSSSSSTFALDTTSVASASRVFSPPDRTAAGLSTSSPVNRNAPSIRRCSTSARSGAAEAMFSSTVRLGVERLVLLRVVAEPQPVPGLHLAGVRRLEPGEDPQQRGLARAVQPEHDDARAPVDGQVDVGEDLQRAVRLRQARTRSAASSRRVPGRGTAAWRPGLTCGRPPARRAAARPAGPCSARRCALVALYPHPVRLGAQRGRLLLGVGCARDGAAARRSRAARGTPSSRRCRGRARRGWRPGGRPG